MSLGSLGRVLRVVGSIPARCEVGGFIRVRCVFFLRPRSQRVHSCSLGSFGRAQWVVVFALLGISFSFSWFIWVCPWCRRVHFGLLGSFWRTLGIVAFILVQPAGLWTQSSAAWGSLGSFGFLWARSGCLCVHLGAHRGVVVLILARNGGRPVQLGSLGSFWYAVGALVSFGRTLGFVGFIRRIFWGARPCCGVHSRWLGSVGHALGV